MYSLLISVALLFIPLATAQSSNAPKVIVRNGVIEGARCKNSAANAFLSIPYARPPVGSLRFAAPQPYNSSYNGTLKATTPAVSCIQFSEANAETGPTSEDCLFLNVWVPPPSTNKTEFPVKVWLYGGGNMVGGISNPLYDGCNAAAEDAIVVSINYRLGALGFLYAPDAGIEGNLAIQDIVLGLEWVQANIAAFGGDPAKVMLFGQSAGASLALFVGTLPNAPSLIRSLVLESVDRSQYPTSEIVAPFMNRYIKNLNCQPKDIGCLRSKSPKDLVKALNGFANGTANAGTLWKLETFLPIVDCKLFTKQPVELGVKVPVIAGSTRTEETLGILSTYGFPVSEQNYTDFVNQNFRVQAPAVFRKYSLDAFNDTLLPPFYAMVTIVTEYAYGCPTQRVLKRAGQDKIPAWNYLWNHTNTCAWLPLLNEGHNSTMALSFLGPAHTAELPYVFGNMDGVPLPGGSCNFSPGEKRVSNTLMKAWTEMAETGTPGRNDWPLFSGNTSTGLIIRDGAKAIELVQGAVDYQDCLFWDWVDEAIMANVTAVVEGRDPLTNSTSPTPGPTSTPSSTSAPAATRSASVGTISRGGAGMMSWAGWTAAGILLAVAR